MEQDTRGPLDASRELPELEPALVPPEPASPPPPPLIQRVFLGPQGLRAGWSVLIFIATYILAAIAIGMVISSLHLIHLKSGFTPSNIFFNELILFVGMVAGAAVAALIERRRLVDYYLTGPRRTRHFFSGLAVGFAALSLLVGELAAGGWLHFGSPALSGMAIARYGLFWGLLFLMVGLVEEGTFRCYLQYTLTRGINFWWALAVVAAICADLAVRHKGNGVWGDYAIALLGLFPCLSLYLRSGERGSFWFAAWVTSTLFGFVHTGNGGETWVGIFSAAVIGFIFCVSVRVTGSAWWAIGCHAGWDWGETYFYGTPDSGQVPHGHLLTTVAAGNPLWSGGTDGPEGSVLILGILVLLIAWLLAVYGRRRPAQSVASPSLSD